MVEEEIVLATESYLFFHSCIHICMSVKELSGLDQKLIKLLDIYISFKELSGLNRKYIVFSNF